MLKKRYERFVSVSGDKFGRLTLTGESYIKQAIGHRGRVVEAVCECGEVKWYWFHLLRNGETKSCGCLRKQVSKRRMTTHNLSGHPLYIVYQEIIERCYNPNNKHYKNYGGRGIEVWKDWRDDFTVFYDWAIENGYEEGKSIDRADNDDGYFPKNCRYATRAEQSRNHRRNRFLTAWGETKCMQDWSVDKRCVVSFGCLRSRIDRDKWQDIESAISTPQTERKTISRAMKTAAKITAFGDTKCMVEWVEDARCVVKLDALRERLKKGWDAEKALIHPPQASGKKGIFFK